MSDVEIELRELEQEFVTYLRAQVILLRASVVLHHNECFEYLHPTYRLDHNTKALTQHQLPTQLYFYSQN